MKDNLKFEKAEKRLLGLFGLFAVIILVSQVLQFMNNRKNDREYRKMLVSLMIIVETSQDIMVETMTVHRASRSLLDSDSPSQVSEYRETVSVAFPEMQNKLGTLDQHIFTPGQSSVKNDLSVSLTEYEQSCRNFLSLLATDKAKAEEFRNSTIKPGFEKCQHAQVELIRTLNTDLQMESERMASASTLSSILILLLGISPFIFLVLYLVFQSSKVVYNEFS